MQCHIWTKLERMGQCSVLSFCFSDNDVGEVILLLVDRRKINGLRDCGFAFGYKPKGHKAIVPMHATLIALAPIAELSAASICEFLKNAHNLSVSNL